MYRVLGTDQQEYGPVGADQIRQWIIERRLNPNSLAQEEGATGWKPLTEFPEFQSALSMAAPVSPSAAQPAFPSSSQNGMAVAGLVFSALAIVCCPCSTPLGVLGITFSIIALVQLKQNPAQRGRELAVAGIVIGAVSLLGFVIALFAGGIEAMVEAIRASTRR